MASIHRPLNCCGIMKNSRLFRSRSNQLGPATAALACLTVILSFGVWAVEAATNQIEKGSFRITYDELGVTGLANPRDPFGAQMISPAPRLGLIARYRSGEGEWLDLPSAKLTAPADGRLVYSTGDPALKVTQTFNTSGNVLDWNIEIETITNSAIEVGDLAISLPVVGPRGEEPKAIFERGFLRHQFISGNGSFLYFVRASGVPPFLIVTVHPGTAFEY